MSDTWIRHNAADLVRHWFTARILTVLFLGLAVGFLVFPERWVVPAGLCVVLWVALMLTVRGQARGATLLTRDGMRFHTVTKHQFIRWQEIDDIYVGHPQGYWVVIYVKRAQGRRLVIPVPSPTRTRTSPSRPNSPRSVPTGPKVRKAERRHVDMRLASRFQ
ncbi:MAG TPA: hypothetical protein VHZ97_21550 [Pseudonocardiaceae bacterium]|nr:hypothetical protein [Pseudonocardiaceae bacterium]